MTRRVNRHGSAKQASKQATRRSGGRPREIHHTPHSVTTVGSPSTARTNNGDKRELMGQARRAGWKGTAYGKAKRFERMLERIAEENARLDRYQAGALKTVRSAKPRSRKPWWMR